MTPPTCGLVLTPQRLVAVLRSGGGARLVVWLAPDALVAAITRAAAVTAPARVATVLTRLPAIPLLRAQLRRLPTAAEPRQVPLL